MTKLKDEREYWIGGRGSSMCTFRTSESSVFCLPGEARSPCGGSSVRQSWIVDRLLRVHYTY